MLNELPELSDNTWKSAAEQFKDSGWLSEYCKIHFYVKSVNRKFGDEIKTKIFELCGEKIENISYIEVNVFGNNGWAFYNSKLFTRDAAQKKLKAETEKANR
ncbi:hypothetical protein [Acetobacter persici]|uniref:hypothetical protein n=1 Tax=Acetobacter persici TaxID=1076596 RepID=UPI0039E72D3B